MDERFLRVVKILTNAVAAVLVICMTIMAMTFYLYIFYDPKDFLSVEEKSKVTVTDMASTNGTHTLTGLKVDSNLELVIANCTGCHSAKLIAQNRATREGWKNTITWMQENQNLWDLGANEEKIIEYLAKNYAPELQGRRKSLENIEWYQLESH